MCTIRYHVKVNPARTGLWRSEQMGRSKIDWMRAGKLIRILAALLISHFAAAKLVRSWISKHHVLITA